MTRARRVGLESSKTRDRLLDAVEHLLRERGYAAVSYRAIAASAGVTPALVQYYFPVSDDVFLATIRRRSAQNFDRLAAALVARPHQPLRVAWEHSRDESSSAVTTEFLALGNHRVSIREAIASSTEQVRAAQLAAVRTCYRNVDPAHPAASPEAALFVVTSLPKMMRLERAVGLSSTHAETVAAVERLLDRIEPIDG